MLGDSSSSKNDHWSLMQDGKFHARLKKRNPRGQHHSCTLKAVASPGYRVIKRNENQWNDISVILSKYRTSDIS